MIVYHLRWGSGSGMDILAQRYLAMGRNQKIVVGEGFPLPDILKYTVGRGLAPAVKMRFYDELLRILREGRPLPYGQRGKFCEKGVHGGSKPPPYNHVGLQS